MQHRLRFLFLLCLLLSLVPLPAMAHTSMEQKVKCPVCATQFTTDSFGSATIMGRTRDLEATGAVGNMYEESVATCPTCHYSWNSDGFEKNVSSEMKEHVLKVIKPRYPAGAVGKVEAYKIAAELSEFLKRPETDTAQIYLNATYVIRHQNGTRQDRIDLQSRVIDHMQKALDKGEVKEPERAVYHYLIGEMYRRQGKFDQALKYYDKAGKDKSPGSLITTYLKDMRALAVKNDDNNSI